MSTHLKFCGATSICKSDVYDEDQALWRNISKPAHHKPTAFLEDSVQVALKSQTALPHPSPPGFTLSAFFSGKVIIREMGVSSGDQMAKKYEECTSSIVYLRESGEFAFFQYKRHLMS